MKKIIITQQNTLSFGTSDITFDLTKNTNAIEAIEILSNELKQWKNTNNIVSIQLI